ncbi:MAG: LacI family DNA-binding transcriptional regulator [Pseudomonadota bacterium]
MTERVTMRDVAAAAGVSPMTVSRALKQDSSVTAETRKTVQAAADRLGYVYDSTAQAFRAQRSGFVAVTLPSINNANFASTHKALTARLSHAKLQLLLGITNYDLDAEERLVRQLLARRPEAFILTGGTHTDVTRKLLQAVDCPVLEMWDIPAQPIQHVVGFSNAEAMALIVDHLAQRGHRRFGFLGANPGTDLRGAERRRGAAQAARRLGLPDMVQFDVGPAPATMTHGANFVRNAGPALEGLDALICVSDPVAFGAMAALVEAGRQVPDEIAVTGFGNFEIARIGHPKLTTVEVGAQPIGLMVGDLIAGLLDAETRSLVPQCQHLDPRLILGGSS